VGVWIASTLAALAALLVAERRGSRAGVWVAKPLASTGFLATALAAGALDSRYGLAVLAALLLSWLGDVLLIPRESAAAFKAGLASFLLGHLAYAGAFLVRGVSLAACALAALPALLAAALAWRWLRPHLGADMRVPVAAYVGVISAMVVLAAGTEAAALHGRILPGALLFYVSDLAVARQRFVAGSFWNRAWGLPLYYGGQLLLATTP
jgi:uncharacterized membrane protein YhhN